MQNPFEYGRVVGPESFCNRQQELSDIRRAMENGQTLFIYSERRLGKTSLLKRALPSLSEMEFQSVYVDLWPTTDEASFVGVFAKAITEAAASAPQRMLAFARSFFNSLRPVLSYNDQGKPEITFGAIKSSPPIYTLDKILEVPLRLAKTQKKRTVIVLDEFQQILEYEDDTVERSLRSTIQHHENVSYILSGSRKHLIDSMLTDRSRPLYRAGGHYPLKPIGLRHWSPFIHEKFEGSKKYIAQEIIEAIYQLTEGHPFYTQHLCHAIWEQTAEQSWVSKETLASSVNLLLDREDYAYSTLWDSLTVNQRKLMEAIATDPQPAKLFSAEFINRHGLKTPAAIQRAAKALKERDLIDSAEGAYFVTDRFLKLWIKRRIQRWYSVK
ncbi:MAG TPA: ATP-binding protein [Candidatus Obscuribacterales bacterium]